MLFTNRLRSLCFILLVFLLMSCGGEPAVEKPEPTPGLKPTTETTSVDVEQEMEGDSTEEAEPVEEPTAAPPAETAALIVFAGRLSDGTDDIFVMDTLGNNLVNLTNNPEGDAVPTWSPDGTQIVWKVELGEDVEEIFVMNADGSDSRPLTNLGREMGTPTWSPDGTQIAFHVDIDDNRDIFVINVDGSGLTQLTDDPSREVSPHWSPDGSQILFTSDQNGNDDIFVMNTDGSGATQLTDGAMDERVAKWSPDGTEIAYFAEIDDQEEIFVMAADGSNVRQLTDNPADDYFPTWSPDGRFLLYLSQANEVREFRALNLESMMVQRLPLEEGVTAGLASIQPVGGVQVAFGGERVTETAGADETTAEVLTTLTLTDVQIDANRIFPESATPIAECTERLMSTGTLTLYADGRFDFLPASPDELSDCFEFEASFPLKGEHEIIIEGDGLLRYSFDEWFTVLKEGEILDVIIDGIIFKRGAEGSHTGLVYFFVSNNGDSGNLPIEYVGDETYLSEVAAELGIDTALIEPLEVTYSVNDFLASYGSVPFLPAPENLTEIEINNVYVAYVTVESIDVAMMQNKGYLAGLGWELINEDVDSMGRENLVYERGSEAAFVRFEKGIGTIVSISMSNTEPWNELPIVPLMLDAQIGELYYQQNYYADATMDELGEFYLTTTNDQLSAAGWSLVDDSTAVGSRGIRWARDGQEVFVSATDESVNIFYLFDELAAVNLDDYNAAALAAQEEQAAILAESALPAINPADYNGEVVIAGSSFGLIVDDIARKFMNDGFSGEAYVYLGNGTANEIMLMCAALEVDGVTAGRALTEDELAMCTAGGAQVVSFVVGRTPTAVLLNPANEWATEMTAAELASVFTTAETWADVNPAWPDIAIERILPSEDSFVINRLVNQVLDGDRDAVLDAANTLFSEDDNVILSGVADSEGAIGLVDYRFALENSEQLSTAIIEGIAPGEADYLLDAPITVYTLDTIMQQRPEVAAYMNYLLVYSSELAKEYEFLPVDQTTREVNEARWLELVGQ